MRVILTGGGTGGHVVPNVAIIEELSNKKVDLLYIGSVNGIEKTMIGKLGVKYKSVMTGKLRRYFSWANLDILKVPIGVLQALFLVKSFGADVVFSKGGYVSLPVVIGARLLGKKVILHESDLRPGLANRIAAKFADKICISFEESREFFKQREKVIYTGTPIRKEVFEGDKEAGYKFTGLNKHRPVLLVMGGSLGAQQVNELVRGSLDELLKKFQIVHITGKGKLDIGVKREGYVQYEYLNEQFRDIYAMSEMVVSRGGANSLFELAALRKKALIIPLSKDGSRGDQIDNAAIFSRKMGWSVLSGEIGMEQFVEAVQLGFKSEVRDAKVKNAAKEIVNLIFNS